MRSNLVDKGAIQPGVAPSYYVECMLYNVPNDQFGTNYATTFCNCINWLYQTDRSKLLCANRQYLLLGSSNVQWDRAQCDLYLSSLVNMWNG